MSIDNKGLINDLKALIIELKEYEVECKARGNQEGESAFSFARVNLEVTLEKHGGNRPATIDA